MRIEGTQLRAANGACGAELQAWPCGIQVSGMEMPAPQPLSIPIEEALWVYAYTWEGRAMPQILADIVRHSSAWYGRDLVNDTPGSCTSNRNISKRSRRPRRRPSRAAWRSRCSDRDDFPLPTLAPLLRRWQEEVDTGRGFYLLWGRVMLFRTASVPLAHDHERAGRSRSGRS